MGGSLVLDSASVGEVVCIAEVDALAMSFIIAVLPPDHRDLVFCSEGKELALLLGETEINEDTTIPVRKDFIKTLALNPYVCIGFGGVVRGIRIFLEELLPGLPWHECESVSQGVRIVHPPINFADSFAAKHGQPLSDLSLGECREFIVELLNLKNSGSGDGLKLMLGGMGKNGPALHAFPSINGKYRAISREMTYGVPCDFMPSNDFPAIENIIDRSITLVNLQRRRVEELCLEVVELVADHSYSCNKNITFRRLSRGFVKEGREILNN